MTSCKRPAQTISQPRAISSGGAMSGYQRIPPDSGSRWPNTSGAGWRSRSKAAAGTSTERLPTATPSATRPSSHAAVRRRSAQVRAGSAAMSCSRAGISSSRA
ncbi:hypothetical protein [Kitasatospora sp. NPDC050463]|uniref:hypothetical protein n=1 Tax=Kitasatospora sp. NPDC050463 TaxID=3155786 RepID=UPI0033F54008